MTELLKENMGEHFYNPGIGTAFRSMTNPNKSDRFTNLKTTLAR